MTLSAYYIDKTEVTVADYKKCVNAGACTEPRSSGQCNWNKNNGSKHPINCVDWKQAKTYCAFVGKRLPTEAEWERAARANDSDIYPWGSSRPTEDLAVYGRELEEGTMPVASKPAAAHGLYDMAGNVWEWVEDCYDKDIYKTRKGRVVSPLSNPNVCPSGGRVLRGGASNVTGSWLRSSSRHWTSPVNWYSNVGFRCVSAF